MALHFRMGAINIESKSYEYPKIASKENSYECPECAKKVILRKGLIKKAHFSHLKSTNKCYFYDRPNESQIHKNAKLLMKKLLDEKRSISFNRHCNSCKIYNSSIINKISVNIDLDTYVSSESQIEYKFYFNNSHKSADVALITRLGTVYLFEILNTHRTLEKDRPEPWFELDANELINTVNNTDINEKINIICMRNFDCESCKLKENESIENSRKMQKIMEDRMKKLDEDRLIEIEKRKLIEEEKEKIRNELILREEKLKQENSCICGINSFICKCESPIFELVRANNKFFCIKCNRWKCRCGSS